MFSLSRLGQRLAVFGCIAAAPALVVAQTAFAPEGNQYPVIGSLPGDQTFPSVSLNPAGGYVVWQDNATDESGLGISARRVNSSLSGSFSTFRVNKQTAGDQDSPKVAMLKDGGSVIVWRSQTTNIVARFINANGTFLADVDVRVNTFARSLKLNPVVAATSDGGAIVVWSSTGQDGSMQGIFGQKFNAAGEKTGVEFVVNETVAYNQRTPAISPLPNGGAIVVWVSESGISATGAANIDVYGRLLTASGPLRTQHEFKLNDTNAICANPSVAVAEDGGFLVAWSQRPRPIVSGRGAGTHSEPTAAEVTGDTTLNTDSWDVQGRVFTAGGTPKKASARINTYTFSGQFAPQATALHGDFMVVWTSLGQDGSQEGVYGQFLNNDGAGVGLEVAINSSKINKQIHPALAANGNNRVLVLWSSFIGGTASFDLFAQRFSPTTQALQTPPAAIASALGSSRLSVAWPAMDGYQIDHYEVFIDENVTPVSTTNNFWIASKLVPATTHNFKWRYVIAGGQISPTSVSAIGVTWDEDINGDTLPDDWQATYWGSDPSGWPSKDADTDNDGASNLQEFLAGTDPTANSSTLKTALTRSPQGTRLNWNTVPGSVYQVQSTTDLRAWNNFGVARFATGANDSVLVPETDIRKSYYRLIRLR